MYIVRFAPKGNLPFEDYYYNNYYDALSHFCLFRDDNSDLYEYIVLLKDEEILLTNQN